MIFNAEDQILAAATEAASYGGASSHPHLTDTQR